MTRLCYCGPCCTPARVCTARRTLQFARDLWPCGLEADLEVQELALEGLRRAGVCDIALDMGDARIVRGLLAGLTLDAAALAPIYAALAAKDHAAMEVQSASFPTATRQALQALLRLYGGEEVLHAARRELPSHPLISAALDDLAWLAQHLRHAHPDVGVGFDLADLSGYAYYSGPRFAIYAARSSDAIVRGGRYDEVGAVFGRNRPAAGFSMDLKQLVHWRLCAPCGLPFAPVGQDAGLRAAFAACASR